MKPNASSLSLSLNSSVNEKSDETSKPSPSKLNTNKRNPNFEALRLLAICFVVFDHAISPNFHGFFFFPNPSSHDLKLFPLQLFDISGKTGVQIFFLITGYFTINQRFKFQKMFSLWKVVLFYSLLCMLFQSVFYDKIQPTGYYAEKIDGFVLSASFFPILTNKFWFMTTYFLLLFVSPVVNEFLKKFSRKQLLTIIILTCSIYYSLTFARSFLNPQAVAIGSMIAAIIPFVFTYSIGAYFALFPLSKPKLIAIISLVSAEILITAYLAGIYFDLPKFMAGYTELMRGNNSLIPLLQAIGFFLLFSILKIKSDKVGKIINSLAKRVLEVYLVQMLVITTAHMLFPVLLSWDHHFLRAILHPLFTVVIVGISIAFATLRAKVASIVSPFIVTILSTVMKPVALWFKKLSLSN